MLRPWNWPEASSDAALRLAQHYGMPRPVADTLTRRGYEPSDLLDRFLNPQLRSLADPTVLADMDRAVERVWRAIDGNETIFIHGDYDVDGITGTAFLTRTLRSVGARIVPFVPGRDRGYGLSTVGVDDAAAAGATVLITVDNGVRAFAEIEHANTKGIDVIVLDHHLPDTTLPDAYAIVNPQRGEHGDAFKNLAAVGVSAKFVHAVAAARPTPGLREAYREALQLVALGTIADVVPLEGENRILVAHGLHQLAHTKWAGMQALKVLAGLRGPRVSASDVAFFLGPRINAAGRMGVTADALELLLTDDPARAYQVAESMEKLNKERRTEEGRVVEEAVAQLARRGDIPAAIVLGADTWPLGVIGIAASRLLERYHRPTFLVGLDGDTGRGSARARGGGFSLPHALAECDDLLLEHGGHAQAAGFAMQRDQLEPLRERLERLAGEADLDGDPEPLEVDAAVRLPDLDAQCVHWLHRLSPFGKGNPEPLFGAESLTVEGMPSVVGKSHLKLTLAGDGHRMRAIAFRQGDRIKDLGPGRRVDAVFHAEFDTWRGRNAVQLVVRDLRPK